MSKKFKMGSSVGKEMCIKAMDILNFDETGSQFGVICGEEIVVPAYVTEVR
jgi:hypothetical protein